MDKLTHLCLAPDQLSNTADKQCSLCCPKVKESVARCHSLVNIPAPHLLKYIVNYYL